MLMLGQWALAIICSVFLSPPAYKGMEAVLHTNIWMTLFFGGALTFVASAFALVHAGEEITRHVVAIAQVLMAALLVFLVDGRIEGSLLLLAAFALLAFYRDWRVLVTASIVIGASSQFIAATHQWF